MDCGGDGVERCRGTEQGRCPVAPGSLQASRRTTDHGGLPGGCTPGDTVVQERVQVLDAPC
jgi:hypothetical protein